MFLGPFLISFGIKMNDIPTSISFSTSYLFANDTKFMEAVDQFSRSTHIQQDLDSLYIHAWCSEWKLLLNSKKCAAMRFSLTSSVLLMAKPSNHIKI